MRLTNSMISGNYLRGLNSNLESLNDLNVKVSAGRKYMKMSEDPASAIKAYGVRRDLTRIELHTDSLNDSLSMLEESENALSALNDVCTNALTQVMQASSGTMSAADRTASADALRSYQEMILGAANTCFSDRYLFGGASFGSMPFTVDGSGNLCYNGENVDTGSFGEEHRYVDIGIGLTYLSDGSVSPQSALDVAYSGTRLLGTGVDEDGLPNNLYNLIGAIADKMESGDLSDIDGYTDKLEACADNVRMQYVGIGEKSNYIEFFTDRLARDEVTASSRQNDLEALTLEEGAIMFSEQQTLYNACLQMGTKLLQPSLLDYLDV